MFVWKEPKINEKEAGNGQFKKILKCYKWLTKLLRLPPPSFDRDNGLKKALKLKLRHRIFMVLLGLILGHNFWDLGRNLCNTFAQINTMSNLAGTSNHLNFAIVFFKFFCLFSFFSRYNFNTNWKKHWWCAWDSNPGPQIVGADETTEL